MHEKSNMTQFFGDNLDCEIWAQRDCRLAADCDRREPKPPQSRAVLILVRQNKIESRDSKAKQPEAEHAEVSTAEKVSSAFRR